MSVYKAKTFKQYIHVYRKYFWPHWRKFIQLNRAGQESRYQHYVEYIVRDINQISEIASHKKHCDDGAFMYEMLMEFKQYHGQMLKWDETGLIGQFTGIKITDMNVYYLFDNDGIEYMQSSLYKFEVI